MIVLQNQIIITNDFEDCVRSLQELVPPHNFTHIMRDEFKIEDAKEAIQKAYITTKEPKLLVLSAKRFNIYAQNALLKILEEPPSKSFFMLLAPGKSTFLPTILSRLPVVTLQEKMHEELEFDDFDLEKLYNLVQEKKRASKSEAKAIIKAMLRYALKKKFPLSKRELEYFSDAIKLIELNSNVANVFISAGLILLTHKKRKR